MFFEASPVLYYKYSYLVLYCLCIQICQSTKDTSRYQKIRSSWCSISYDKLNYIEKWITTAGSLSQVRTFTLLLLYFYYWYSTLQMLVGMLPVLVIVAVHLYRETFTITIRTSGIRFSHMYCMDQGSDPCEVLTCARNERIPF